MTMTIPNRRRRKTQSYRINFNLPFTTTGSSTSTTTTTSTFLSRFGLSSSRYSYTYTIHIPSSIQNTLNISIPSLLHSIGDLFLYLLGPLLIVVVFVLVSSLSYTFFTIIIPLLSPNGYWTMKAMVHECIVIFIVTNIIFNYVLCVMTNSGHRHTGRHSHRHTGRHLHNNNNNDKYDSVVRELANVTHFEYPETEEGIQLWKFKLRDFIIQKSRMRSNVRSNVRSNNNFNNSNNNNNDHVHVVNGRYEHVQVETSSTCSINMSTSTTNVNNGTSTASTSTHAAGNNENNNNQSPPLQRRNNTSISENANTNNSTSTSTSTIHHNQHQQIPVQEVLPQSIITPTSTTSTTRPWMILGPHDWGYCEKSNLPKPPRSHFDFVTRSLVLNMDHYCPWMFNVGK